MDETEHYARTAWGLIAEPGDSRVWRWIAERGPTDALAELRSNLSVHRLAQKLSGLMDEGEDLAGALAHWRAEDSLERTDAAVMLARKRGLTVLDPHSPQWPEGLGDLGEYAPHSLWVQGDASALASQSWVGIVGSRRSTGAGIEAVRALLDSSWAHSRGVVSGGALGIDTAAHQAALARSLPTTAVLAGGLDSLYPAANAALFARVAAQGALVSESPCTARPLPHRFLSRNRIIAALADAVIVVEAATRSGALNTAGHAAALGRPLGVVPGRWSDPMSAGCWAIVRDRRGVVLTEPEDGFLLFAGLSDNPTLSPVDDRPRYRV